MTLRGFTLGSAPRAWKKAVGIAMAVAAIAFSGSSLWAQNQSPAPVASSDLGRANLSRVAASPERIKAVLVQDPGLMVELKRWVAKDATDHGQIVGESDLTKNTAISFPK